MILILLAMTSLVASQDLPAGVTGPCGTNSVYCILNATCGDRTFDGATFKDCLCQPGTENCKDTDECVLEHDCKADETCVNIFSPEPNQYNCVPNEQPCESSPCNNGGNCENKPEEETGYLCTCINGFFGDNCDHRNGGWSEWVEGTCDVTCGEGSVEFTRTCDNPLPEGDGSDCGTENIKSGTCTAASACPQPCDSSPCNNGGNCENKPEEETGYLCTCINGFFGDNCDHRNGGWSEWVEGTCGVTCGEGSVEFTRTCDNPSPEGDGSDCGTENIKPGTCIAAPCPVDYCDPNPCLNGGTCTNSSSSYECTCINDFAGTNCENPPQEFSISQCAGRKTPVGQIVIGLSNPVFSQLAYDPPFSVDANDGSIMTSAVGDLADLKIKNVFKFDVVISEGSFSTKVIVIITVNQDICHRNVTKLPCERAPTNITRDACDKAFAASTEPIIGNLLIPHPNSTYHFIYCKSRPYGICEKCAEPTIFSEECGHCIHTYDVDDVPKVCVTPPPVDPVKFCELAPCPNECEDPHHLYPHPDSTEAFCQCQPGHKYGGCHLCPKGIEYFNEEKQCCDYPKIG